MAQPEVRTIDYHTGGEPFRIVAAPPVELPGATVAVAGPDREALLRRGAGTDVLDEANHVGLRPVPAVTRGRVLCPALLIDLNDRTRIKARRSLLVEPGHLTRIPPGSDLKFGSDPLHAHPHLI